MTTNLFARLYEQDLKIIFNLDPASRAVYLALCFFGSSSVDKKGNAITRHCYPSQQKMADLLGCSTGTIRRGIARLKRTSVDGTLLFTKDNNGNVVPIQDHHNFPKMLIVKRTMFKNEYYLNINSSHVELSDSSEDELSNSSEDELSNSSEDELSNSSEDELSIIDIEKKTLIEKRIDPKILNRFKLIFDYFAKHPLTSWSSFDAIDEFKLLLNRSSLNVYMELLHIGAYQLEKIRLFEAGKEEKKFWRNKFWIAGMSQWLSRKHKSTLDLKRSSYITELKKLIPDLDPKLILVTDDAKELAKDDTDLRSKTEAEKMVEELIESIDSDNKNRDLWITTLKQFSLSGECPVSLRNKVNKYLNDVK